MCGRLRMWGGDWREGGVLLWVRKSGSMSESSFYLLLGCWILEMLINCFSRWRNVIGRAVVKGKKGWVTVEDRLEWLMEGQGSIEQWQWNGQGY